jgi:ABC-2 type transport system permease protein
MSRDTLIETASPPSPFTAFWVLVGFSFRRTLQIREMGWAALGLLTLLTILVASLTHVRNEWSLPNRFSGRFMSQYKDIPKQLDQVSAFPLGSQTKAVQIAIFSLLRGMLADQKFLADYAFLSYSRGTVIGMYLGFLLPMFTLAYGTGAIGAERESRTMIWLFTRPLPRWSVYLAKYLGVLPWCLLTSVGGFVILGLAGGQLGQRAIATYWPAAVAGTIAFTALFHFIGALFRRPTVIGLVYIFFFETLVANIPGSLKQISLNYYVKSLIYSQATEAIQSTSPENLDLYAPTDVLNSWLALLGATVLITVAGMWFFSRQEPQEET